MSKQIIESRIPGPEKKVWVTPDIELIHVHQGKWINPDVELIDVRGGAFIITEGDHPFGTPYIHGSLS